MTEESAADLGSAPDAFVPETEAQESQEGQTEAGPAADGVEPEEAKKSDAAKRREREKAYRARLQSEHAEAVTRAQKWEAEAERWRTEAKALRMPTEQDFPDPLDYTAERAGVSSERRLLEREAKNAGEVAEAAKREAEELSRRDDEMIANAWAVAREEAKQRYADFEAVALRGWEPSPVMARMITTSDVGADVAYHLGQNRALAAQIAQMNPVEAARAIGRIEATLSLPKARTETNAPSPINPVRGSAGAGRDPDKMSYAEFKAYRENGGTIRPRT